MFTIDEIKDILVFEYDKYELLEIVDPTVEQLVEALTEIIEEKSDRIASQLLENLKNMGVSYDE